MWQGTTLPAAARLQLQLHRVGWVAAGHSTWCAREPCRWVPARPKALSQPPLAPQDRSVRLWNPHRGISIKVYTGHGYDVRDVAIATDNSK